MAAHLRNFRLTANQLNSSFWRAFSTKYNRNLVRRIREGSLLTGITRRKSTFLSSQLQKSLWPRNYHAGQILGIKASDLSNDKPLNKADVGCPICSANISFTYKDVLFLSQFLSPEGNLLNKRVTGVCGKQQIKLEKAIKISRRLGLLPKCGPVTLEPTNS